jgi:hypothetical protein
MTSPSGGRDICTLISVHFFKCLDMSTLQTSVPGVRVAKPWKIGSPFGVVIVSATQPPESTPTTRATRLVNKYNLFVLEVLEAWTDPAQKHPKTIHHHGHGRFAVDGETIMLKSRMR